MPLNAVMPSSPNLRAAAAGSLIASFRRAAAVGTSVFHTRAKSPDKAVSRVRSAVVPLKYLAPAMVWAAA